MGNSGTGGHQGRARLPGAAAVLAALIVAACGSALPTDTAPPALGLVGPTPRPPRARPDRHAVRTVTTPTPAAVRSRRARPRSRDRSASRSEPTSTAVVWYVVDGDTIRLTNRDYVRLIGMDTPETVKPGTPVQPYGPQASADLKALLAGHTTVVLERDISNTDYYGRLLRFVWI